MQELQLAKKGIIEPGSTGGTVFWKKCKCIF